MITRGRNTIAFMLLGALLAATQNASAHNSAGVPGQYELQRRPGDNPPITLPATGLPGEEIRFNSQRSDGLESWAYKWRVGGEGGGSWSLIAYTFKLVDERER